MMNMPKFLPTILIGISIIILPKNFLVGMEKEEVASKQNESVTLQSNDGQQFVIPRSLAQVAKTVEVQLGEGLEGAVPIATTGKNLQILIELMRAVQTAERAGDGNVIFIKFEPVVADILKSNIHDTSLLVDLLQVSNHYDIARALVNVLAYFIALQIISDSTYGYLPIQPFKLSSLDEHLKEQYKLPREMRKYIKKHVILIKANCKEFTVADYIKIHGQPPIYESHAYDHMGPEINLANKKITSLQGVAFLPSSVESLILGNNCIVDPNVDTYDIKEPFRTFLHLAVLDLANNELMTLPADFLAGLKKLKSVGFQRNYLIAIPEKLFEDNPELRKIDLDKNRIKELPPHFAGLKQLDFLDLSSNQLTSLPVGFFIGFDNLKVINLDKNHLQNIPLNLVNSNIVAIDLSSNRLQDLPTHFARGLNRLQALNLRNNTFTGTEEEMRRKIDLKREATLELVNEYI